MPEDSESLAELVKKLQNLDEQLIWDSPVEPVLDEDLWKWKLYGDWPCFRCQYNLKGLQGPEIKCPECGQNNDLRRLILWKGIASPESIARLVNTEWCLVAPMSFLLFLVLGLGSLHNKNWVTAAICLSVTFALPFFWYRKARHWLSLFPNRVLGCWLLFVMHATCYFTLFCLAVMVYHLIFYPYSLWISIPPLIVSLMGYAWVYRRLKQIARKQEHAMTWASWAIAAREQQE